ncbi:hypothetical protein GFB49_11305 [Epibacterium sp. SM1979]|uniref:Uncharacterized protein n=1 Tax=Tritonibacter litoralis TaxID=2662264 RepID=A0A843YII8_9RHOB|nr:hypothetical protein [Tritonibacter litoralis]MQQ09043.1 hypothetical protein [Tritonibacter litoralis]
MEILIKQSDSDEFRGIMTVHQVEIPILRETKEHGFDGTDLVRFVVDNKDPFIYVTLGYWLAKGKILTIDNDGIHIKVASIKDIAKYIKNVLN